MSRESRIRNAVGNHRTYFRYFRNVFEILFFLIMISSIIVYAVQSRTATGGIRVDFTTLSISLAGFCLVAASFTKIDTVKDELYRSTSMFIYAAASFIFFYMAVTFETVVLQLSLHSVFYPVVGLSLLFGAFGFTTGIIRLLRAIDMSELSLRRNRVSS